MATIYRARIFVNDEKPFGDELMQVEVGVPARRLRATRVGMTPGGAYTDARLMLIVEDREFLASAWAPPSHEIEAGSRFVHVPGNLKGDPLEWDEWILYFDESSAEDIEAFIRDVESEGALVDRIPAGS